MFHEALVGQALGYHRCSSEDGSGVGDERHAVAGIVLRNESTKIDIDFRRGLREPFS